MESVTETGRGVSRARSRLQLAIVVAGALLLAALGTHALSAALGIRNEVATTHKRFGTLVHEAAQGAILGSSLSYDGVDWNRVADSLGIGIESWPVPGSSPAEWEYLQPRSPQATTVFVGVSLYDLNEAWLCDFRADIVPLRQTMADLWQNHVDPGFARRVCSCYPRAWARALLPTLGRSSRVIFGLRDKTVTLLRRDGVDADGDLRLRLAADYTSEERISDWPHDRLLRRLEAMRGTQGKPSFSGPKHLAFLRLLEHARRHGSVVVIVMPVSPPFLAEVLSAQDVQQFEASLTQARLSVPSARWVRLDRLASLKSPEHFYDLVHLNMQARQVATDAVLRMLAGVAAAP